MIEILLKVALNIIKQTNKHTYVIKLMVILSEISGWSLIVFCIIKHISQQ